MRHLGNVYRTSRYMSIFYLFSWWVLEAASKLTQLRHGHILLVVYKETNKICQCSSWECAQGILPLPSLCYGRADSANISGLDWGISLYICCLPQMFSSCQNIYCPPDLFNSQNLIEFSLEQ